MTAYGGELQYTVRFEASQRSLVIDGQPDVVLQGNDIFLEHYSQSKPFPRVPQTVTVTFREVGLIVYRGCTVQSIPHTVIGVTLSLCASGCQSAWRRADGQPCTREHLLMALADVSAFMIRATYADNMAESRYDGLPRSCGVNQGLSAFYEGQF